MSKISKAIISISVDDGRKDAFRLYTEILKRYNIPATFNIVSGWVGHERSVTINELKQMQKDPLVEIAGHGYSHKNTDEDITKDRELLYSWLDLREEKIGFASPGSGMKNDYINQNEQHLKDLGFLYIRTGRSDLAPNEKQLQMQKELKEQGKTDFVVENVPQLTYSFDGMCVNSAPVLNFHTVEELKELTRLAINQKACIVFMFHSVAKKGEYKPDDLWSYDFDRFVEFAEFLAEKREQGEIEILTTKDAFLKGSK